MNERIKIFLMLLLTALPAMAGERILAYDSLIQVQKNGDLLVTEKIRVRAEGKEIRRGIYRDIPKLQHSKWGLKTKKPFEVISVKREGKPENYVVEEIGQGGMRIRIGREQHFVEHGEHNYEIVYRTGKQVHFEKERDVLYWNAIGTEWIFPIDKATATVVLPEGFEIREVWGYTGAFGKQEEDYEAEVNGNTASFKATREFGKEEGMTVVVVWPPGQLDAAVYEDKGSLVRDHPGVLAATTVMIGALLYNLVAWVMVGKDPDKGMIIPHYDPPPGFSPAAVRYLEKMGFDNTCFSAAVVGLAVKGAVTIEQDGKSYTLKNKGEGRDLRPEESQLYKKLLGSSKSIELKQSNHSRIGGARKGLRKMLSSQLEKTHFVRNIKWWLPGLLLSLAGTLILVFATGSSPAALFLLLWLSMWTVGTTALVSQVVGLWRSGSRVAAIPMALFSLPFVAGWFAGATAFLFTAGPWSAGGLVVAGVMNVIFYHLIKAPTRLGRRIMDHIEGFKHYLGVAEEERLNLYNPPEKTPELFERFLPYALALDCEQQWSEKFDAVLQAAGGASGSSGGYRPSFYSGSYTGMDRAMGVAAIGGALTGALASSSSAPSSSGSSGGGSSGGGGGGGGGGGW